MSWPTARAGVLLAGLVLVASLAGSLAAFLAASLADSLAASKAEPEQGAARGLALVPPSTAGPAPRTLAQADFAPIPLAPLGFTPPVPGSYRLERILQVPDGAVLDSDGSARRLQAFTTGRITVFSFIYTYCADPQGCPLAAANLHALEGMLGANPRLRDQVRFVSMSFDPAFDNPAMMRSYGADDARPGAPVPWHFLTTASNTQLAPILAGFGQDVQVLASSQPEQRAPLLRHLLKVYLIDRDGVVREIYSPVYLHPRVLYNDIVTLLQQSQ